MNAERIVHIVAGSFILLSLARSPHLEKCGAGNSAKKEFAVGVFTPKTDVETEAIIIRYTITRFISYLLYAGHHQEVYSIGCMLTIFHPLLLSAEELSL